MILVFDQGHDWGPITNTVGGGISHAYLIAALSSLDVGDEAVINPCSDRSGRRICSINMQLSLYRVNADGNKKYQSEKIDEYSLIITRTE